MDFAAAVAGAMIVAAAAAASSGGGCVVLESKLVQPGRGMAEMTANNVPSLRRASTTITLHVLPPPTLLPCPPS